MMGAPTTLRVATGLGHTGGATVHWPFPETSRPEDPCWPQPVWGNLPHDKSYTVEQLREWQAGLVKMIGLVPAPL